MKKEKPRRLPRPRPKTLAEFFAREEEAWEELTATWRGLPDKALIQPGACGPEWSMKDVMNHVAAWLEATSRMISEWKQGRKAALGHGIEKFNALEHATSKDRSLAVTRRRLNRARREVLALIATLPEADVLTLEDRIGWWIKYNTYGHYSQHIYELMEFRKNLRLQI
jgi:hypothetical protein